MIVQFGNGLVRLSREPQFCLETSSPLITLQVSDYESLDLLGLDEHGEMRLDLRNELFPFAVQAYQDQLLHHFRGIDWDSPALISDSDFTPRPKAFRWIRWFDQLPNRHYGEHFGKYMVGHCFPEEVNKTRWLHCLLEDKFFAYPLASFPKDFDDIWIYEDEESEDEDA